MEQINKKIKENKIIIRTEKTGITRKERNAEDKLFRKPDPSPVLIILYMLGIYGMISALANVFRINLTGAYWLVVAGIETFSLLLWYVYIHKNKFFPYLILIFCGITMFTVLPTWNSLMNGFGTRDLVQNLTSTAALPIVMMVSLLLFYLEFVIRRHSIIFLICLGLVILSPLEGTELNPVDIVLIVLFQFGFFVFNTNISRRKKRLNLNNNSHTTAVGTIFVAAILLISFIPSFLTQHIFEDDINYQVFMADAWLQDSINNVMGNFSTNLNDGTVSRGNLRQSGKPVFNISIDENPGNNLYLKGFTGANYDGSSWSNAYGSLNMVFDYTIDGEEKRWFDTYYKEFFTYDLEGKVVNYYCRDYLQSLSSIVGIELKSMEADNASEEKFVYCYDKNGREVAVSNGMTYDLFTNTYNVSDSDLFASSYYLESVAYILREGSGKVTGTTLSDAILEYISNNDDPEYLENSTIEKVITIDSKELPLFPSIIEQSRRSEAISDIYSEFGRKNTLYDMDTQTVTDNLGGNRISSRYMISPVGSHSTNVLYPYHPAYNQGIGAVGDGQGNITRYYEGEYIYGDCINMSDRWDKIPEYYEGFVDLYQEKTNENYTSYDVSRFPRLAELCRNETPNLDNLNEITTFILYTLQTQAKYSKTPGSVPFNTETVEYFLFENHQGYCVHFATTAALMYRMLGVPSRYVTGYSISSGLFEPKENGDYHYSATVSDMSAHAWVEIFLKDYGWVPVEVTPTLDGRMRASYPGYSEVTMYNIMNAKGWKFKNRDSEGNEITDDGAAGGGASSAAVIISVLIGFIILSLAALVIKRLYMMRMQKTMNCRIAFDRFIDLVHYGGYVENMYGSEPDFSRKLSSETDFIEPADAQRLVAILEADNYSQNRAGSEDNDFVRELYFKTAHTICGRIPVHKRIIFYIWKNYL